MWGAEPAGIARDTSVIAEWACIWRITPSATPPHDCHDGSNTALPHLLFKLTTHAMNDLPPLPCLAPGRYRHYKGGEYEVIGVARHSETREALVVYRPLYNSSGLWVRPYAMFVENLEIDGHMQARFAFVA